MREDKKGSKEMHIAGLGKLPMKREGEEKKKLKIRT